MKGNVCGGYNGRDKLQFETDNPNCVAWASARVANFYAWRQSIGSAWLDFLVCLPDDPGSYESTDFQ